MNEAPYRYFIINKPYNIVSQFISSHNVGLLGDIDFHFPAGTHAVGRLDNNSEGLLILTTNKKVTKLLFQGAALHERTYLVQVKNTVSNESLQKLKTGVTFRIKGGGNYHSIPCMADIVKRPSNLAKTENEIPGHLPHTWLQITLTEGKFHQVRKMAAAIHHPCRRLIRVSIENLQLDDLQPGCVKEYEEEDFFSKLNIDYKTAVMQK